MATTIRARIYARGEVGFAKFLFLPSWFAKLLEANFSCFAKIRWCQVYLTNYWSFSGTGQLRCRGLLVGTKSRMYSNDSSIDDDMTLHVNNLHVNRNEVMIRATPKVCQILLGKTCVLTTCKKICQVKKESTSNSLA
jgi:hypothetical protein